MIERERRRIRWPVSGLAVCMLLASVASAETGEDKVGETITGLCANMDEVSRGSSEMAAGFASMTPKEWREFAAAMTKSKGQPAQDISDDEAREAIDRAAAGSRDFPRLLESFCRLRAAGGVPEHGYEIPETGTLVFAGVYETVSGMREEYDPAFEPASCDRPFDMFMRVGEDGEGFSVAYIFCERGEEFELIRAYRKQGSSDGPWERFDDLR